MITGPGARSALLAALVNPTLAVVADRATWRALWTQDWEGVQQPPTLPPVDFVLNSVRVVGLGRRGAMGYSVAIDSVVIDANGAVLFGTESDPGTGCGASMGTSAPVHMVPAPGHPPASEWRIATVRRDCGP